MTVTSPKNPLRNIEVRGLVVAMTETGAVEHNDQLTLLYLGKPHFFGDAVPADSYHAYGQTGSAAHGDGGRKGDCAILLCIVDRLLVQHDRSDGVVSVMRCPSDPCEVHAGDGKTFGVW